MTHKVDLGILISGSGTNLQAIIDAIQRGEVNARIRVVISNNPQAYGLVRAQTHGLPTVVVSHNEFPSREAFDTEVVRVLHQHGAELIILAGFNRLLSPFFIRSFPQRIMNIHPALLPAFPGLRAQKQALEYGVRFSGATVHFVDEEMDHGPIIIQAVVPVYPDDSEETLEDRILKQEHRIYPRAIQLFAEGRLEIANRGIIIKGQIKEEAAALLNPAES
jgi:phosphoribosylglycinamide formyltransferase 1